VYFQSREKTAVTSFDLSYPKTPPRTSTLRLYLLSYQTCSDQSFTMREYGLHIFAPHQMTFI